MICVPAFNAAKKIFDIIAKGKSYADEVVIYNNLN